MQPSQRRIAHVAQRPTADGSARLVGLALAALLVSGCAQTITYQVDDFSPPHHGSSRILLMPTDIELSVQTASGLLEPRADWTSTARGYVEDALEQILEGRGAPVVRYRAPDDPAREHRHTQLVKLHEAVGGAILMHKVVWPDTGTARVSLPTLKDRFDYSLGQDAGALGEDFGANYALFVYLRDSYSSGGRVLAIAVAAVGGVTLASGQQYGFASLVELSTGRIVWFNYLQDPEGDLREPKPARRAVLHLLSDLPL